MRIYKNNIAPEPVARAMGSMAEPGLTQVLVDLDPGRGRSFEEIDEADSSQTWRACLARTASRGLRP